MKLNNTNEYKIILTVVVGFLILVQFFNWQFLYPYITIFGVLTLGVSILRKLFIKLWFSFAKVMGSINGTILLSILFFIIVTPIAILFRLFNKKSKYINNKKKHSYFNERNHLFVKDDLEFPF